MTSRRSTTQPRASAPVPRKRTRVAKAAAETSGGLAVVNKYEAAGSGPRMAGWNPATSGPNRALQGLQKIRDRAQDAVRNEWQGESAVQKWTTNLIGIGIKARLTRIKDAKRRQELIDLWDDFIATCDADGVLNHYGQQTLGTRSWLAAGEVFVRRRPRRTDRTDLPVPLQVQLIEAEYVPMLDADTYVGLPPGNKIRSGIEFDRSGQRVAYWMYREHPHDPSASSGMVIDASKLIRVLAADVAHVYMPARAGALRGVSMLAPTLTKLRDVGNYQDAVLTRQQLANLFVAFVTNKLGLEGDDTDPLTGKSIAGSFDKPLMGLSPGIVQELEDGQDVKFANPPEAGTTYSDYLRTELLGVAAGSGLPYELFSGDIINVSDRTLRVIINDFRRYAEQRQWQVIIPQFCQRVRNWFAEAALLAGKITADEFDAVKRVEWAPHGWAYIHPVQDPQGKKMEVDAGFRSRSSVVGERGDDPEVVDAERQSDDEREQTLKIGPYSKGAQIAAKPAGGTGGKNAVEQDGIDNNEYPAPSPTAPK